MNELAQKRVNESRIEVISAVLNADHLPFADCSFDTVVSTWTLCSISDVRTALSEVARVLKPGGHFLFLEHGLSQDPKVQRWQQLLTPVNKMFTDGCQINRNIREEVAHALRIETCDTFDFKRYPRTHGSFYCGSATKYH
jgi:ubiquinone/menaquinone biosynthesis C-methylase UbiE